MSYLDVNKSVIISSPAGSGKTEKLARRYIALLKSGVDVERILAITFTEKAAAEMKQRILRILREEDSGLFHALLDKMSLMRVSTIHSFCATLIRRFSFEAGIDADYTIENEIDSRILWDIILHDLLMRVGAGGEGHDLFIQAIGENGFRGLQRLKGLITDLFQRRPFSVEAAVPAYTASEELAGLLKELAAWSGVSAAIDGYPELFEGIHNEKIFALEEYFLTTTKTPRRNAPAACKGIENFKDWASKMHLLWKETHRRKNTERAARIQEVFQRCHREYTKHKTDKSVLDFSDLEHIAYTMLTRNPEWANILYAFDEKTDHVLVDEFQDTNRFQWAIIDSLTEEWRSGLGAKREEGIQPTIFLVGDEKQSIYLFRGANVEIFRAAKERYGEWLGHEFYYEEVKENYRCLPVIIDFANAIFSRIMNPPDGAPAWVTRYAPFVACRDDGNDRGRVELILLDDEKRTAADARMQEARVIARRIQSLTGSFRISERGTGHTRPCRYMDVAILLRKRTHLQIYEQALSNHNIPFVAVKGIGFYQEPEVAVLRSLVFFLANPGDDYSLYVLLKSPLFQYDESAVSRALTGDGSSLFSNIKLSTEPQLMETASVLESWLVLVRTEPLAEIIEHALVSTAAWRHFHTDQKRANIKKFIRLVEELEAEGRSIFKIRAFLESTCDEGKEPKANVNTEGMNAVKIMTIHAAKGLEFPIVFIPGVEEQFNVRTGEGLIFEREGALLIKTIPESSLRAEDGDYRLQVQKELEEQKRLFYVAATRAENALFMTGCWSEKGQNLLSFLKDGLGLERTEGRFRMHADCEGFSLLTAGDVEGLPIAAPEQRVQERKPVRAEFIPLEYRPGKDWRTVTESLEIQGRSGESWILPGEVIHRVLEKISKRMLAERDMHAEVQKLLSSRGVTGKERDETGAHIANQLSALQQHALWRDIVLPREDAFAELPFVYETESTVYKGRIDRIIKQNDRYNVYDYKTFPVKDQDINYLVKEYTFQLAIYKKAVQKLFNTDNVRSFIIFTHTGELKEV